MAATARDINEAYPKSGMALARKIVEVSNSLGIPDPGWLANLINFETAGQWTASVTNSLGYTGLIQFGTAAAGDLGTTTAELRAMSEVEQMDYVEAYFRRAMRRAPLDNPIDLYMAVFYPSAMGNPEYQFSERVQAANNGIDTPREYARRANRHAELPTGMDGDVSPPARMAGIGGGSTPWWVWAIAVVATLAILQQTNTAFKKRKRRAHDRRTYDRLYRPRY